MSLGGGIIGGIIGAVCGGPWGALIGAGIGSWLTGDKQEKSKPESFDGATAFPVIFRCLGKFAKSDGRISEGEAAFVSELLKAMKVPPAVRKELICEFNHGRDSEKTFYELARELQLVCCDAPLELRQNIMTVFCSLAAVDDKISMDERAMLSRLEEMLDTPGVINEFYRQTNTYSDRGRSSGGERRSARPQPESQNTLASCYELLGISSSASDQEVKKAFRKKVQDFHPDHIQGKGLSDEFIQFAKQKMQQINEAYETICKERGIN